ncbi:MAG: F0F1 ATP synthase subunit B [Mycoplasma sp.]|nr:F0F1 ATP synthase subunit B [Candidatus Hennigella equi]
MEVKNSKTKGTLIAGLISMISVLPLLVSLSSCKPLEAEWVVNNLFPNLWVFLTHIIAAVILVVLMTWLVWKPTKNSLQKRHDYIAKQISDAQQAKETATIELNEANQLKVNALSQAMTITTQAKAEAFGIIEKARLEAKQTANKIVKDAKEDVEKEKRDARANVQDNIINIAFDVAESVLNKEVDKQDKDKYIDDLLESIEKDIKENK